MLTNLLTVTILVCMILPASAQVTKISNNTDLETGIPINQNKAIFIQNEHILWMSDGTEAGTVKLDVQVKLESNSGLGFYKSKLFFSGLDENNDAELWQT